MRTFFYIALKQYCRAALWFYYRKWQVQNIEPVPTGPVIFVANHQNAFLDAVLVSCSTSRNPWFLTRANVFEKPWARLLLSWMKMTPVYRFRDGFSTLRKNEMAMETCVNLLSQGESILIFAEGNHDERWSLRPFQKGFARIAIAAAEKNISLKIVPIGLQYDSHSQTGSRVLVSFGEPISVNELIKAKTEAREQIDLLIEKTSGSIKSLMLHFDLKTSLKTLSGFDRLNLTRFSEMPEVEYEKRANDFLANRVLKDDLVEQLKIDQLTISKSHESIVETTPSKQKTNHWLNPVFVFGYINYLPASLIIRWIIKRKMKDPQFTGSLKFALGMVIVPLLYILQTGIVYLISKSIVGAVAYLILLPVSYVFYRNSKV
jgi:1-acyl-sn-glycerol-3-phosphate acyltransferase